jgi:long-subunit fatty acid transport protein
MFSKISKLLVGILVFMVTDQIQAQQFAPVGTAVAQFMEIGVGARATAMGEAYTALTNDAGSVYWNPAGLAQIKSKNAFLAYNRWPADIAIGGLAVAWNINGIGVFAVNALYLSTDDMAVTTVYDPEGSSGEMFSITNYALGLSYARNMTDQLSAGITVKLVNEKYLDHGYTSWALDLGTIYKTGFHGLNVAMSILHFGPEVKFSGTYIDYSDPKSVGVNKPKNFETYSLPINFRFGLSLNIIENTEHILTTTGDMVHPNNNLEQYNWGLEYGFRHMFFVRGGYKFNADAGGICFGLGVNYDWTDSHDIKLDYAFSEMGDLSDVHRLSLAFSF